MSDFQKAFYEKAWYGFGSIANKSDLDMYRQMLKASAPVPNPEPKVNPLLLLLEDE